MDPRQLGRSYSLLQLRCPPVLLVDGEAGLKNLVYFIVRVLHRYLSLPRTTTVMSGNGALCCRTNFISNCYYLLGLCPQTTPRDFRFFIGEKKTMISSSPTCHAACETGTDFFTMPAPQPFYSPSHPAPTH